MREVEFRGKDKQTGVWRYGSILIYPKVAAATIVSIWGGRVYKKAEWSIIPETMGQFTGLHDSAGNKVFEGDIVDVLDDPAVIKWDDAYTRFVADWGGGVTDYDESYDTVGEVIGNIHDDPELLCMNCGLYEKEAGNE